MKIETTVEKAMRDFEVEKKDRKADLILFYFGLAIYWAQCIEKTLENMLVAKELSGNPKLTTKIVNETFDKIENSRLTLGNLVTDVKKTFSIKNADSEKLMVILNLRNHFAHKFFKVNSFKPYTENGQRAMIMECTEFIDNCKALDKKLVMYSKKYELKMGITEELINESFRNARQEEYDKERPN